MTNSEGREKEQAMAVKEVRLPLTMETLRDLRAGDRVRLTGTLLTGRDAAHKRLAALLAQGKELPVSLQGETIYYVGPAPARPGQAVGSAGPTSSYRMDAYTPPLLELGLMGMIGKGRLGPLTMEAMRRHPSVYFGAVGGTAVLISKSVLKSEVAAYPDLGPEAIYRFTVEGLPAVVAIDMYGGTLYEEGPKLYRETQV
ncbi:MAG TPA: Fe-S-containing hydro-lyase [Candidatus Limnocylindria bacterium]|nr:Fe-S-containing hydro-lyase [Candidatus Limnocylindria bacterium]